MLASGNTCQLWPAAFLVFAFLNLFGCAKPGGQEPRRAARTDWGEDGGRADSPEKTMNTDASSADYMLSDEDYDVFRPGKSKDEILGGLHWRGNLEMATEHKGCIVCAISYGVFGGPFSQDPRGYHLGDLRRRQVREARTVADLG